MDVKSLHRGAWVIGGLLGLTVLGCLLCKLTSTEKNIQPPKAEEESEVKNPKGSDVVLKTNTTSDKSLVSDQKPPTPNDDFPLRLGSQGERVRQLQMYLLRHHGTAGIVTDCFDTTTQERVERFLKLKTVSQEVFETLIENSKTKR